MELSRAGISSQDVRKASGNVTYAHIEEKTAETDRRATKREAYAYFNGHFNITKLILQSGEKLRLPPVAIASACTLYHRFWKQILLLDSSKNADFDSYMIATTVLYIASKSEESPRKLRDVINVCHRSIHPDIYLDVGSEYWKLHDSIVSCELFVLRVLAFRVEVDNPHKYLLHYLKSLQDWVEPNTWKISNLSQTCWSILYDSIHIPVILNYSAPHVAIAIVFFGVLCTGMEIPSQGAKKVWWKAMCNTIDIDEVQAIIGNVMDLYDYESKPLP